MSRCLVTGGAGFIGSNLVDALISKNHEVLVIDDLSTGVRENVNPQADFVKHDLCNNIPYFIKKGLESIDFVFHLAAFSRVEPSIHNPLKADKINVGGTVGLLKACADAKVKKVMFTSSGSVYGNAKTIPTSEKSALNPMSPYGLQKQIGEQYCKLFYQLYGLDSVVFRYANVYGPRQPLTGTYCNVMGIFTQQRKDKKPLTIVGTGKNTRDYIHVADVVNANLLAMINTKASKADVFNLGSGVEYSVNDVAKMVGGKTTSIPERVEPKRTLLNSEKANKLLGWEPTINLKDWVKEYKKEQGI